MMMERRQLQQQQPFERIEVREDGYLWLVNYCEEEEEESNDQQPLLLHSTLLLLKQLREKWHHNEHEHEHADSVVNRNSNAASVEKENDNTKEQQAEESSESNRFDDTEEECDEKKDDDSHKKEHNGNSDKDHPTIEGNHDDDKSTVHSKDKQAQLQRYRQLQRETNLADRIMNAMNHIQMFRHDTRKKKRRKDGNNEKQQGKNNGKNNTSYRETKVKALEQQRERLLQKKRKQEEQQQQQNDNDNESGDNDSPEEDVNDNDFQPVLGKKTEPKNTNDNDDESMSSALQPPQDPYVRLVRTLNSIRALVPVIRPLLFHADRERKDLRFGRKSTQLPKKKKPSSWLIGNHVFDIVTTARCKSLQMQLQDLVEAFLPYQVAVDILDGILEDERTFWGQEWLKYVWVPPQPGCTSHSISFVSPSTVLRELQEANASRQQQEEEEITNLRSVEDICRSFDQKFFANEQSRNDAQKAKKVQNEYQQAVHRLHNRISHLLHKDFPGSRLSVYGSCLSNLSLKASDVDLSLYLPQAEKVKKSFENGNWSPSRYEKEMSKLVREVWRKLMYRKPEFADMVPVTRARVPVVKGCYLKANNPYSADGSLHFDICFLNDIAVANSSLLREYSLMDESVRQLMIIVKKWAKENGISSAQDHTLSSYGWMNMVVFYLQCIEYVPNLQCPKLMEKYGLKRDPNEYWHNVNNLDTCYLTLDQALKVWTRPEHFETKPVSVTALLYGFFHFYAIGFMGSVSMVSIKRGREEILPKTVFRKCSNFFSIEDPFETFDSHCPHDLGIPVNESQSRRIFELLQKSEEHLGRALLDCDDNDENTMITLWPSKEQMEVANTNRAEGRNQGGSKRKKGKRGGKPQHHAKGNGGGNNSKNNSKAKNQQTPANTKNDQDNNQQSNTKNGENNKQGRQQLGRRGNQKKHHDTGKGKGGRQGQPRNGGNSNDMPIKGKPKNAKEDKQEASQRSQKEASANGKQTAPKNGQENKPKVTME